MNTDLTEFNELISFLTPKLTEEDLTQVKALLVDFSLKNYWVGYDVNYVKLRNPFLSIQEAITVLDNLERHSYYWEQIRYGLAESIKETSPAEDLSNAIKQLLKSYLGTEFVEEVIVPRDDDYDICESIEDIISQDYLDYLADWYYNNNLTHLQDLYKVIESVIVDYFDVNYNGSPEIISIVKQSTLNTTDPIKYDALVSQTCVFVQKYYNISSVDLSKLWDREYD